jgi:hypothetical protein
MKALHCVVFILGSMTFGCETFTPPSQTQTILSDKVTVLDTTATRRGTYFFKRAATKGDPEHWVMVAEPPPDAAMASAVKAAIDANIKSQTVSGSLDVTQTLLQIQQTQTVLLARDTLFRLSEAYANGTIESKDYVTEYEKVLDLVKTIANGATAKAEGTLLKQQNFNKILNDPALKPEEKTLRIQGLQ